MQFDAVLNACLPLLNSSTEVKSKIDPSNLEKLLHLLANKGETQEQFQKVVDTSQLWGLENSLKNQWTGCNRFQR